MDKKNILCYDHTIEVNGCELLQIVDDLDLTKELTTEEEIYINDKIIKRFYDEYKEDLYLDYYKVKSIKTLYYK